MSDFFILSNLSSTTISQETNSNNSTDALQKSKDPFSQILTSFFVLPNINDGQTSLLKLESESKKVLLEKDSFQNAEQETSSTFPTTFLTNNINIYEISTQTQESIASKEVFLKEVSLEAIEKIIDTKDVKITTLKTINNTSNEAIAFESEKNAFLALAENSFKLKEQSVKSTQNTENSYISTNYSNLNTSKTKSKEINKKVTSSSYQTSEFSDLLPIKENSNFIELVTQNSASLVTKKKNESFIFSEIIKQINKIEANLLNNPLESNTKSLSKVEFSQTQQSIETMKDFYNLSTNTNQAKETLVITESNFNYETNNENTDQITTSTFMETIAKDVGIRDTVKVENIDILNQISKEILANSKNIIEKQPVSLEITLFPRELGKVEIKMLKNGKGELSTNIIVNSEQAYNALSNGLSQLRDSLEQSGIFIEQMVIENNFYSNNEQSFTGENKNNQKEEIIFRNNSSESENISKENITPSLVKRILSLHI